MAEAARPRRRISGVSVAIAVVVIIFLCACVGGLVAFHLRLERCPRPPATCQPTQVPVVCPPTATPITCPPTATPKPTRCPSTAKITLKVRCAPYDCCCTVAGLYTVVQWQDKQGAWQDVQGWAGTLDKDGCITWRVDCEDLGKGPFRWVILSDCRCAVLAVSEPFDLPAEPGETVRVEVSLGP